jgi:hypothetical protein
VRRSGERRNRDAGGGGGRARPATTGSRFKGGSVDRDRRVEEAGESKGAAQRCRVGR